MRSRNGGSNPCREWFSAVGASLRADAVVESDHAINNLFGAINLQARFDQRHTMSLRRGQGYLQIGYLTQEDPRFLAALHDAVAAGRIDQIDVGSIIGPKVYNWIVRTVESAPPGHLMKVTGRLNVGEVAKSRATQISNTSAVRRSSFEEPGERWTDANIEQYEQSVTKLKLREACRKFWGTIDLEKCGPLKFVLQSTHLESIVWEKAN